MPRNLLALHTRLPLSIRQVCTGAAVWALVGVSAYAQEETTDAVTAVPPVSASDESIPKLKLKPSYQLAPPKIVAPDQPVPTFVSGDHIEVKTNVSAHIEGDGELRKPGTWIKGDVIDYLDEPDNAIATGHVRVYRDANLYTGDKLDLIVNEFKGHFDDAHYEFGRNEGHGEASHVEFIDENHMTAYDANFTTCKSTGAPDWMPDWILQATKVKFDYEENVGRAYGAVLKFKDFPILPVPSIDFPLSNERKSGFLPPTIEMDNISGVGITTPYYWNIAPNRDATLSPTVMTRRGVDLGGEYRYLDPTYYGTIDGHWMPSDQLRQGESRWGYSLLHHQTFIGTPQLDWGTLNLNMNLNRVSDDDHWKDFPREINSLTQRLLADDIDMGWSKGNWSARVRSLRWQTLQDPTSPITPPYDISPELHLGYNRDDVNGFKVSWQSDVSHFISDPILMGQPNAQRWVNQVSVAYPWETPGWFITPKFQIHQAQYQFDSILAATGLRSAQVTVPTFSLDTGLVFERNVNVLGRDMTQTLEPRLFYVKTPYRNQSFLPNYDSALNDFNFATIYTENAFGGDDRVSDSNLVTAGLTTRWISQTTGAEWLRFDVAERFSFSDQNVTLPGGTPVPSGANDILVGSQIHWLERWGLDGLVEYNPKTHQSERSAWDVRYEPGRFKVVTASYRLQAGVSEEFDIGWQWPLFEKKTKDREAGRWYTTGRVDYDLDAKAIADAIVGFEYDAGCWIGRIVLDQLGRGTATASQRIFFQIEFVGFARLGSSALQTLKSYVPRYHNLGERVTPASPDFYFTHFDQ